MLRCDSRFPKRLGVIGILVLAACNGMDSGAPGDNGQMRISFPASLFSFSGLVIESVHLQAFRQVDVEQQQRAFEATYPFDVERDRISISAAIPMEVRAETLSVVIDLNTAAGRTLFSTNGIVVVTRGGSVSPTNFPPPFYLGPGSNAARLLVGPQTPTVAVGQQLDFTVTATDVQGAPVDTVYTSWRVSAGHVNALGRFTAPSTEGQVYVVASTPSGAKDSTLVTVLGQGTTQISGTVVDGATNAPLSGATVKVVASTGDTVATTATGQNGVYGTAPLSRGIYSLVVSLNGYVTTTVFAVEANGFAVTAPTVPLAADTQAPGTITGGVSDATNGNLISGPTLELRAGVNASGGTPLATVTGDVEGVYFIGNVQPGTYTITASAPGYVSASVTAIALGDVTTSAPEIVLSPIGTEVARIVLTWGATPPDLDAHLTGPDSTAGGPRFHVYFGDPGRLDSLPHAGLDIDNIGGFGPETITISKQFSGVYRYSVHDFSNSDVNPSSALAGSGARVQLFINGALAHEYFVPNQPGTLWTVFELNGNTVTPINAMSYVVNSSDVSIRGTKVVKKGNRVFRER